MPIISNNTLLFGEKMIESPPPASPVPVSLTKEAPPVETTIDRRSMILRSKREKDHGILYVDGKEKKVSKHSAYLLDMLSIDND